MFYIVSSLPDSGANRSIWHPRVLVEHRITINDFTNEVVTMADTGTMICTGYILLRVRHGDDPERRNEVIINALVSPSMWEDAILCYNNLVCLKVLPPRFPGLLNSSKSRAMCTEAITGEDNEGRAPKDKDSIEKVIADFPDVFDSTTLTPIKGEPMKIHINRDATGYRPMQVGRRSTSWTPQWSP